MIARMYRVILEREARRQLRKIPDQHTARIKAALQYLSHEPLAGKKLRGSLGGRYALRVWPYRIIYEIRKKEVLVIVLAIGHRQGVYK